jgi:signal transduction histidine kinase/PAS domain-containing protein
MGSRTRSRIGRSKRELEFELGSQRANLELLQRQLDEERGRLEELKRRDELHAFMPIGCCTLDERGTVREVNLAAAALLDRPRAEIVGRDCASLLPSTCRDGFARFLARCRKQAAPVIEEIAIADRTVRLVGHRVDDGAVEVPAIQLAFVDISDLERRRSALHLLADASYELGSARDLASCLERTTRHLVPKFAHLCMIDLVGGADVVERVVSVHAEPARASLAQNMRRFAPRPGGSSLQARVIASGKPILLASIDDRTRRAIALDGHHLSTLQALQVSCKLVVPLASGQGVLGALTLASDARRAPLSHRDVELATAVAGRLALAIENVQLHEAARRAIAARDAALAVISHDLNNSLGTVVMLAESLARRGAGAFPQDDRLIRLILQSTTTMRRLIHDLADVSSMEAGRLAVARRRNDLASIIGDVVAGFVANAAAASVALSHELPAESLVLDCDRDRIEQVLANLIGNAIKFTPAGGSIVVRAKLQPRKIEVAVEDTGRGIATNELRHVFDRFWQGRDTAHLGSGLGLAIAKGIVEAHGGTIRADSRPGRGSRFRFTLPRVIPLSTAARGSAARSPRRATAYARSREIAAHGAR